MQMGGVQLRSSLSHLSMIRQWAAEELEMSDDCVLMVKELSCLDCDCDRVETLIAVLSEYEPPRQWRIPLAADVIEESEVRAALRTSGEYRPRDWRCPD